MPVLEIIGWVGSALVVVSLMQARVLRFRVMNLAGSVIAAGYNAIVGIWPFAAMNAIIAVIDVYWLARLLRERHDAEAYDMVQVDAADRYLRHVVGVHASDIARYYPSFAVVGGPVDEPAPAASRWAYLVLRGDETVGVVVVRDEGAGLGELELDYVTPGSATSRPASSSTAAAGHSPAPGCARWSSPTTPGRPGTTWSGSGSARSTGAGGGT